MVRAVPDLGQSWLQNRPQHQAPATAEPRKPVHALHPGQSNMQGVFSVATHCRNNVCDAGRPFLLNFLNTF